MGSEAGSRSWSSRRRAPDAALGGLFIRSFFFFLCFLIVFSFYFEWHPVAVALLFCPFLRPVPTLIPSLGACRRLWLLPHRHDLSPFSSLLLLVRRSSHYQPSFLLSSFSPRSLLFALRPLSRLPLFPIMLPSLRAPAARRLTFLPPCPCPCPCPRPLSSPSVRIPTPSSRSPFVHVPTTCPVAYRGRARAVPGGISVL